MSRRDRLSLSGTAATPLAFASHRCRDVIERPVVTIVGDSHDAGERRRQLRAGIPPQVLDHPFVAVPEILLKPDVYAGHDEPTAIYAGTAWVIDESLYELSAELDS